MSENFGCTFSTSSLDLSPAKIWYFLKETETTQFSDWIKENINLDEAQWILSPRQNQGAYTDITFPLSPPHRRKIKFNSLYYPPTIGQWAEFYGLMDGKQVKDMLTYYSSKSNSEGVFTIQQTPTVGDIEKTVETTMIMLDVQPLCEVGVGNGIDAFHGRISSTVVTQHNNESSSTIPSVITDGSSALYVVRMVDERYFYQYSTTGIDFDIHHCMDWQEIIDHLTKQLHIKVKYQSHISPNYAKASGFSDLIEIAKGANPAIMLDAVLYNLGMVAQRDLDGDYFLLSMKDIFKSEQSSSGLSVGSSDVLDLKADFKNFQMRAGGKWDLERRSYMPAMRNWAMPAQIVVYYPIWNIETDGWANPVLNHLRSPVNNIDYFEETTVTTNVSDVLGIVIQKGQEGSKKVFRNTARAFVSSKHPIVYGSSSGMPVKDGPVNAALLDQLTVQISEDYVLRKYLSQRDEVWNEIFVPTLNGLYWVEWEYGGTDGEVHTRITGEWMNYEVEELMHDFCSANPSSQKSAKSSRKSSQQRSSQKSSARSSNTGSSTNSSEGSSNQSSESSTITSSNSSENPCHFPCCPHDAGKAPSWASINDCSGNPTGQYMLVCGGS